MNEYIDKKAADNALTAAGFLNVDVWFVPATITKCKKCGKIKKENDK